MKQYDLTFPQKNIYSVDMISNDTALNTIAGTLKINKNFKTKICEDIIRELVRANDSMRTRIIKEENNVKQYFDEYKPFGIETIDMSGENLSKINEFTCRLTYEPIDILSSSLFKFYVIQTSECSGMIYLKLHHIIGDAWTIMQVINELVDMYKKAIKNEDITIYDIPSYIDYIESENNYLNSDKYLKDEEFWKNYMLGIKEPVTLKENGVKMSTKASRYTVTLTSDESRKIIDYSKANKVSPYTMFLAALSNYIYRIKDADEVSIGTPILNRSNFKEKKMLGCFISTIPMRIKVNENMKFIDLAKDISSQTMTLFRHQKYPITKTIENVHNSSNLKGKLYNIVLSYQNARASINEEEGFYADWIFSNDIQDDLEIHIMDMNSTGNFTINYDYLVDLFDKLEIEYLHTRIMALIMDAIDNIDVSVEDIRIMSKEEEKKILCEFNSTDVDYPKDKTVIELFEEQAENSRDKVALVFKDKQMTYGQLNEKANSLAHYLKEKKGINQGDFVAVKLEKSFELLQAILAILKLGAGYVPMDKNVPDERMEYMIDDAKCKVVIDDKFNFEEALSFSKDKVEIKGKWDDTVYVMYTSGTTGKPKGVMVNSRNIIRLVKNNNFVEFELNDVIAQTGSIAFDAATFEIWGALLNGLKLCLISKEDILDFEKFKTELRHKNVSIMWLTAPLFNKVVDFDLSIFDGIRYILTGGDVLSCKHINKLIRYNKDINIVNGYGPTENTTFSTTMLINKEYENSIPIGRPIANSKCYITDKKGRLLPMYVVGELVVAGDGVAKGYLNRPELTKEKFIDNGKKYKTGDNAFFDINGIVKFKGRIDNQVKIRGFRVELDEIKNTILAINDVDDVFVSVFENNIYAVYISSKEIGRTDIISIISKILPTYMVPKYIYNIETFPLNRNGKVDKQDVEKYVKSKIHENISDSGDIALIGMQKKISDIFCDVLNVSSVSLYDNFFDIGGDSLLATEFITKSISCGLPITYSDLYKNPSIYLLSKLIENSGKSESISKVIETLDYTDINKLIKNDNIRVDKRKYNNILLIGATGFLGAHILNEILLNTDSKVVCLIRKKNNENDINQKLSEKLKFFFGNKHQQEFGNRLFVVNGNIENDNLGIEEDIYGELCDKIDMVINCAANVKHFGNISQFYSINVEAVNKMIDFCLINDKKLVQISTLSVSGNILETGQVQQENIRKGTTFDEKDLYIGQDLDNVYAYTKFMAEKSVLDAVIEKNLNAVILRMGNLTGRLTDGKFQPNVEENAFANRVKNIIELGVMPDNILEFYLEFTPIDLAAVAVVKLSFLNEHEYIYHLFNHKHLQMTKAYEIFREIGIKLDKISKKEMSELIKRYSNEREGHKHINGIILDINKNGELDYSPNIIVKSNYTIEKLESLEFEWPVVDDKYVKKYMQYLIDIGFINK